MSTNPESNLPEAVLRPQARVSAIWILPILAVLFAGWLGYQSWRARGVRITVELDQGHSLQAGDEVRYLGIAVGEVQSVELTADLSAVRAVASLQPEARQLARAGSRFWVVRPQVGPTGVAGLETIVGPRYLAVLPGTGAAQRHFVGLGEPPIVPSIDPDDLEIVLVSQRRESMRAGAPVLYRQVPVGVILSVGLASDAGAVEARVLIYKAFVQLVRPETRFWSAGGVSAEASLRGLSFRLESLEALLVGGIALATPRNAGEVVTTGRRYELADQAQPEWLQWTPLVAIGSSLLPAGSVLPAPLRASAGWREGRVFKSSQSRHGWVLQTRQGLLGPADLLIAAADSRPDTAVLEVGGEQIPLAAEPAWSANDLALVKATVTQAFWPDDLRRSADQPEDCIAVADSGAAPLPLSATRLTVDGDAWRVDPAVAVDESWHGASVLARSDGRLVGLLLVGKKDSRVALLPAGEREMPAQ